MAKVRAMELILDPEKFDEHQAIFIAEMVKKIKIKLQEAGLKEEDVPTLTANIAFSIASIIDDTSAVEHDDVEGRPYLTFRTEDDRLIHCGENAYTYEHVFGVLRSLFDE
ncbi:MAG: hypothetical protein VBE63_12090 [Lamprobacter sp.]|uniref:hypothetical protein n=1 Tax=Lamprobacter sp. TaxID=3100796 RepID=UPI002B25A79F|nr:hypothetical protein [Lamprobacter sp.]MEA3640668.1 hypothetical protein [Lamprobacter sp.]